MSPFRGHEEALRANVEALHAEIRELRAALAEPPTNAPANVRRRWPGAFVAGVGAVVVVLTGLVGWRSGIRAARAERRASAEAPR